MDKLTEQELERLTSHQRRRYLAGRVTAAEVWAKGWLGKPEYAQGSVPVDEGDE